MRRISTHSKIIRRLFSRRGSDKSIVEDNLKQGKIWTTVSHVTDVEYLSHPLEEVWGINDQKSIELHLEDSESLESEMLGVLKEDKNEVTCNFILCKLPIPKDLNALVEGFTSPALAAALRDRESTLQKCAKLVEANQIDEVRKLLFPFTAKQVLKQRDALIEISLENGFDLDHLSKIQKILNRMPRHVAKSTEYRASVMIPLCNVQNKPSILFTKRSEQLKRHKNEVCFPGGKVDEAVDKDIYNTAIREMIEEIGVETRNIKVLGILRCDWSEVASLVGLAVTPVVGFIGDITREHLKPNPQEVSHCFTIPFDRLLDEKYWVIENFKAPVFTGGPYIIWGLTGYILRRFMKDIMFQHISFV